MSLNEKGYLTTVSLFSGGGGLDLGLEAVGFRTLFATDSDDHSCISLNWGKETSMKLGKPFLQHAEIQQADILDLEPDWILEKIEKRPGEIALLSGGPPCQAFSVNGKRLGRDDPRGQMVYQYLRILAGIRPQAFLFENVTGLRTVEAGEVFDELTEKLANPADGLYYELSIFRLNAVDYAVPQFRDRIFIIGHADGKAVTDMPPITSKEGKTLFSSIETWRTVRDAFRGLPPIGSAYPANHVGRKHGDRVMSRYASMRPGERDKYTRINRLDLNRPSFTIVVGSDKGGGKGHVHPVEPREVTPRESARIQTFPDWWAFSGTSRHPIRQVGNAVPPLLAAAIGNEIKCCLFDSGKVDFQVYLSMLNQEHLFWED